MKIIKAKKGFTLLEVLLATAIFVIISVAAVNVFVRTVNIEKKSDIKNSIYEDARVLMEQLTGYVQNGAIDYEEYYSMNVSQKVWFNYNADPTNYDNNASYGLYYGVYGSRFIDPNMTYDAPSPPALGKNPTHLGVECENPPGWLPGESCSNYRPDTIDNNTGENPFDGNSPGLIEEDANAFCSEELSVAPMSGCDTDPVVVDELYLIREVEEGTIKTIIAKQLLNKNDPIELDDDDYAVGMVELKGIDHDSDGVVDLFKCREGYNCGYDAGRGPIDVSAIHSNYYAGLKKEDGITEFLGESEIEAMGLSIARKADHEGEFKFFENSSFIPITPFRINVKQLKFIISPVEDPYKAFGEDDVQVHPTVTILLTVEPSEAERDRYPGGNPGSVTLQRTISAGVHSDIKSYASTVDLHWIEDLLGGVEI